MRTKDYPPRSCQPAVYANGTQPQNLMSSIVHLHLLICVTRMPCKSDTAKSSMLATGNNSTSRYLILLRMIGNFNHDKYSIHNTGVDLTHMSYGISNEQRKTLVEFPRDDVQAGKVYRIILSRTIGIGQPLMYKIKHDVQRSHIHLTTSRQWFHL